MDAIVNQPTNQPTNLLTADDEAPTEMLYKALEVDLSRTTRHTSAPLSPRERVFPRIPALRAYLLVGFLSVPEDIEYLSQKKGFLEPALTAWQATKCGEYVYEVEAAGRISQVQWQGTTRDAAYATTYPHRDT